MSQVKISKVKIKNFRSIEDIEIALFDRTAIVGQNSSGKSNIIKAINSFFNYDEEKELFESGQNKYNSSRRNQPNVEISFVNFSATAATNHNWVNADLSATVKVSFQKKGPVYQYTDQSGRLQKFDESDLNFLKGYISFVSIPIRRDHGVAHQGERLLFQAITQWKASKRNTLSQTISALENSFKRTVLDKFTKEYQSQIPLDLSKKKFALDYSSVIIDDEALLKNVEIWVNEDGKSTPLSESGSGTENIAVFSLYSYLASLKNTSYVMAFEEPEQNLHPQAQYQLIKNLSQLNIQTIFTTHSPAVVDTLEHNEIIICKKISVNTSIPDRPFKTVANQIDPNFFASRPEIQKYKKFHIQTKSDFIFSNFVIVTESIDDALVLQHYLQQNNIDLTLYGISFVSLNGVNNINYMDSILTEAGIPHLFVIDKDFFVNYATEVARETKTDLYGVSYTIEKRKQKLDNFGRPIYLYNTLKSNAFINNHFNQTEQSILLTALKSGHNKTQNILTAKNIVCMNYAFEIDLIGCPSITEYLYSKNYSADQNNNLSIAYKASTLFRMHKKAIKSSAVQIDILTSTPPANRPQSFIDIKKIIKNYISSL